jgi:hypothetical protein
MTLWEFACAREGFVIANGGGHAKAPAMADDRLAELGIEGF